MKYFFNITIPETWQKIRDWYDNLIWVYKGFLWIFILSIPLVAWQTYWSFKTAQYNDNVVQMAKKEKAEKNAPQSVKYIKSFIKDRLQVDNDIEAQEMFDDTNKFNGKYSYIIEQATQKKTKEATNEYLNGILDELMISETKTAGKIPHDFKLSTKPGATDNEMDNGVMFILWDSKAKDAKEQAKKIDEAIRKVDYTIKVYDKQSAMGTPYFSAQLAAFLYSGEKIRSGFDAESAKTGVIYGFNSFLWTYQSDTLKIPNKMPVQSLAK